MTTIHHGEPRGWVAGCRDACCRMAIYAYNSKLASDIRIHGDAGRRRVDATGTKRRLQALHLMGWVADEIAEVCGWRSGQAVRNLLTRKMVSRETAERVSAAYELLWARWLRGELRGLTEVGVRRRTIAQGREKGWLPGAVWDDIDDPDEKPQGIAS